MTVNTSLLNRLPPHSLDHHPLQPGMRTGFSLFGAGSTSLLKSQTDSVPGGVVAGSTLQNWRATTLWRSHTPTHASRPCQRARQRSVVTILNYNLAMPEGKFVGNRLIRPISRGRCAPSVVWMMSGSSSGRSGIPTQQRVVAVVPLPILSLASFRCRGGEGRMISREKESETPPFFPDVSEDVCHVSSAPKGVTQLSLECWFGALIWQLVKGAHCVPKPSLQIIFKYVQVQEFSISELCLNSRNKTLPSLAKKGK